MKLQKLELNAFRGATKPFELPFHSSKKLTMVFGENGTGKSTIADAFTCLCTSDLGSIQDRSGAEKKFMASANCNISDVKITLTTDAGSCSTTFSGTNFIKDASTTYPNLRHLRRSQIVKLVDAQPAKRYEALQSYLDVGLILNSETKLRDLKRSLETETSAQVRTLTETTATIESAWETEGKPNTDWRAWAKLESEKDVEVEKGQVRKINTILRGHQTLVLSLGKLAPLKADLDAKIKERESLESELDALESQDTVMTADLLKLLEHGKSHINNQETISECPLCQQDSTKESILSLVEEQLQSHAAFKELTRKKEAAVRAEGNAKNTYENLQSQINGELMQFEDIVDGQFVLDVDLKNDSLSVQERIDLFGSVQSDLEVKIDTIIETKERSEKTISQKNLIKSQYDKILDLEGKVEETQDLLDATKKAYEIVETERKKYIEEELESISGEVDALYQRLHPDERIGSIKLTLKSTTRKSVELSGDFQNLTDIAPQSLYSESHLDTLGICVFLALAKKYGTSDTILILDDVVMSVDASHLDRFIDLLHDIGREFAHVLITTHYRPWRDRYRFHRAPANDVHFVELRNWSIETGMRLQQGRNQIQELREALDGATFDRQIVAGKAGIILENLLDYLSVTYACRMRRKPGEDYTLGELLDGTSKLSKHLKVEKLQKDEATEKYDAGLAITTVILKSYFDTLKGMAFIRNQVGAHFNLAGSSVTNTEVEQFGRQTLELVEHLTCPDTGAFPSKRDSGSYHETRNKSIRMHPFQEPSR